MQFFEIEGLALRPEDAASDRAPSTLKQLAAQALHVGTDAFESASIVRRSIDARKKGQPLFRYTLRVALDDKTRTRPQGFARKIAEPEAAKPLPHVRKQARVIVIGAGPAGLFAAHRLSKAGLKPLLLDRGKAVEPRAQDVQKFKRQRVLDTESNYCFGEGGAGTWSDGKLTTRIGDERIQHVLETIVRLGGPEDILIDGKPHLGTNRLVKWLRAMRAELIADGVEIHWQTRVEGLLVKDGRITGVRTNQGEMPADAVLLAPGHSARDVLDWLAAAGVTMESKAFAVGFRVEHPQALIDEMQYGRGVDMTHLPASDYRLTENIELAGQKRGIYSFCMCPGGVIVPTGTEPGGICINGMSHASRNSPWANSALVVSVEPKDFGWGGGKGVLAGIEFQRRAERAAFARGGNDFRAPAQRVTDFIDGKPSTDIAFTSFRPGTVATSLDDIYPAFVTDALRIALKNWGRRMRGYVTRDAHLLGVETRSSSPVRITRGENLQSLSHPGLYPVGEGAGYAGGIMSAAVDGLRAADAIIAGLV